MASAARRDLMSKKMGELLLKGWCMLAEECPLTGDVPLMQDPKTGRKFSIATGQFTDEMDLTGAGEFLRQKVQVAAPEPAAPSVAGASPAVAPEESKSQVRIRLSSSPRSSSGECRRHPSPDARLRLQAAPEVRAVRMPVVKSQSDIWSEQLSGLMLKG